MKKVAGIALLSCGLLLAGCGNETAKETSTKQEETKTTSGSGENSQVQEELKAKIVDEASYVKYDADIDFTTASYFAVVENTSKVPVDITETTVTFLDKEGTVIGTNDSSAVWVSPQVLKPGQKTYLSTDLDIDVPADQFGKAELNVTPMPTTDTVKDLPIEGDSGTFNGNTLHVDGKVKNTSKNQTDYITMAAAIYTMDDKFVGTTYGQVDSPLNAGASVGFETWNDTIPAANVPKQFKYEVLAYMYPSKDQEGVMGEDGDGEVTE
ncbi:FxLYD domain-containing protein [Priestia megaterium]|uniref:FxLYD domain-containing protein n=1 Tax=Priestia megaterium TaxID=1404 RepID=UPI002E1E46CA|nr:FxLYD domain-containing protein [Priestia megaterium]